MNKFVTLMFALLCLAACGGGDELLNDDPTYIIEDNDTNEHTNPVLYFFQETGLKPSDIDKIDYVAGLEIIDNDRFVLGQKNSKAWIAKFNNQGNEIYSYEQPIIDGYNYSIYQLNSYIYSDDKLLFLKGYSVDTISNSSKSKEQLVILNKETGVFVDSLFSIEEKDYNIYNFQPIKNGYCLRTYENAGYITDDPQNILYVLNDEGTILYKKRWTQNEQEAFPDGIIFVDYEIVCPQYISSKFYNFKSYPIVNLRNWKLIKKFDSTNGLVLTGEHSNEQDIYYSVDSTYLYNDKIRYVYKEYTFIEDEITGYKHRKTLSKYYYEIDPYLYTCEYKGKYEN